MTIVSVCRFAPHTPRKFDEPVYVENVEREAVGEDNCFDAPVQFIPLGCPLSTGCLSIFDNYSKSCNDKPNQVMLIDEQPTVPKMIKSGTPKNRNRHDARNEKRPKRQMSIDRVVGRVLQIHLEQHPSQVDKWGG